MDAQIARAEADKLERDDRVVSASVKGDKIVATVTDKLAKHSLKSDLEEYVHYVELTL